jgi:hypothetical protein
MKPDLRCADVRPNTPIWRIDAHRWRYQPSRVRVASCRLVLPRPGVDITWSAIVSSVHHDLRCSTLTPATQNLASNYQDNLRGYDHARNEWSDSFLTGRKDGLLPLESKELLPQHFYGHSTTNFPFISFQLCMLCSRSCRYPTSILYGLWMGFQHVGAECSS